MRRALDRIDVNLAATQLGVTLASLALGWFGEPTFDALLRPLTAGLPAGSTLAHVAAAGTAFALITILQIVLGELAPKNLALQRTERAAFLIIGPLTVFSAVFRPAILLLNVLGAAVLRPFGIKPDAADRQIHSTDELRRLVAESTEGGLIEGTQKEVVERAFDMTALPVRAIMTPRRALAWIDADKDGDERLAAVRESRHSLLLVARGELDALLGVVRKQDLLDAHLAGEPIDPLAHLRDPVVLPSTATVLHLLGMFKERPVMMAVVVDEYGVVQGVVTQANLLEAMAGDIPEEDDPDFLTDDGDGGYLVEGSTPIGDVAAKLNLPAELARGEYHTLAGLFLDRCGGMPSSGAFFEEGDWRFEVVERDNLRIRTLKVGPGQNRVDTPT